MPDFREFTEEWHTTFWPIKLMKAKKAGTEDTKIL
jgi:hypothetical protein